MEISTNIVDDINRHHGIAITQAKVALQHAKAAGKLLLEARASLSTGQLGNWLPANVSVPLKQAQHYMAAAEGKWVPIRLLSAECTPVESLIESLGRLEFKAPSFIPLNGYRHLLLMNDLSFHLTEPAKDHPGFHFVSSMENDGKGEVLYFRRPVQAIAVEIWLQAMNLGDPAAADWHLLPCKGVDYAGQTLGFSPPEKEEWQK